MSWSYIDESLDAWLEHYADAMIWMDFVATDLRDGDNWAAFGDLQQAIWSLESAAADLYEAISSLHHAAPVTPEEALGMALAAAVTEEPFHEPVLY
jgi:hypothetical protein